MGAAHKIAAHGAAVAKKGGPSVIFEIAAGLSLGVAGGAMWKMYHLNLKRKTEELYSSLEKGELTVSGSQ
ncbi:hypothetical protein CLOM_g4124 [Closterium sp. NIES-68]|nr:hypothetical protein CLOM_g4124 [Closterium sp. NIES-68]GJP61936.1 hypothetical protein CLOP_g19056 [Closterium sp. NIES-67]GJP62920.1 hypothetical protein CLOP_g19983 [Closterium sp. NIES-67]